MNNLRYYLTLGLLATTVATLTACGGGGGGASPTAGKIVNGVAATGLAIAGGRVSLNCTSGSTAPVTTSVDGSFSVDVSGVALPCVARVAYTDSTGAHQLHSLVKALGNVNITPITDMVVANLSATGHAKDVDANEVKNYSDAQISTATRVVKSDLESRGVGTAYLPLDVIGTRFEAAHGSKKGDAHDGVLDALKHKFEEQRKTLNEVENEFKTKHESRGWSTATGQMGDAVAGKAIYEASCQSCHGARYSDAKNASEILEAIRENEGGMGYLANTITSAAADSIATYMARGLPSDIVSTTPVTALTTQTITFTSPGAQMLGTVATALSASASSGLVVSVGSTTPAVCTVNANVLTLLVAGNCTLSASQVGNTIFAAAATKTVTFGITDPSAPVVAPVDVIPVAANGKALYSHCSGCHGAAAAGGSRVLHGANSALTIQSAIKSGMGGMGSLASLSLQNLADIAAYLATPNI